MDNFHILHVQHTHCAFSKRHIGMNLELKDLNASSVFPQTSKSLKFIH